jgi:Major Facilitator Superfamily
MGDCVMKTWRSPKTIPLVTQGVMANRSGRSGGRYTRKLEMIPTFIVVAVDATGMGIILPLLPFYSQRLGATPFIIGSLISVYALCQLVAGPVVGTSSDRYGRRGVLIVLRECFLKKRRFVTAEQDYIAAGQFRGGEQLVEAQQVQAPGTILAFLEPIYQGGLDGVTPGSSCIVNANTSNHDLIASKETGAFKGFVLHAVDAVDIVHAMLLRVQALLLPIKTLVLSGH